MPTVLTAETQPPAGIKQGLLSTTSRTDRRAAGQHTDIKHRLAQSSNVQVLRNAQTSSARAGDRVMHFWGSRLGCGVCNGGLRIGSGVRQKTEDSRGPRRLCSAKRSVLTYAGMTSGPRASGGWRGVVFVSRAFAVWAWFLDFGLRAHHECLGVSEQRTA